MTRRTFFVTFSSVVLGMGVLAILLAGLLRYQYRWYQKAAIPPGQSRKQSSDDFLRELVDLWSQLDAQREWYAHFTDMQINSYLGEGFRQSNVESRLLPDGISEPRVVFDTERIHLGFRYGRGLFSTIITIDLHVWIVPQEQNVVVLELEGFHAGALPVSARSLLEQISEVGRGNGIGVNWFRDQNSGHPVAVLRFQEDQQQAKWVLQGLQLATGSIRIQGGSDDNVPHRSGNPAAAPGTTPAAN
jgi:hypothetical protein